MAPVYFVEEWLLHWIRGHAVRLAADLNIRDIDSLCDVLVKQLWEKAKSAENPGILVVCADWKPFESSRRFEQNGVRLLKHLRLTPELGELRRMHAIVLSFEPVEELIRRKPGSLVLLSRGVTFLRLPDGLDDLKNGELLAKLAAILADAGGDDFRAAVRADYRPTDSAHSISNWWGVRQVRLAARAVRGIKKSDFPESVEHQLRLLRNKEAIQLYGAEERFIAAARSVSVVNEVKDLEKWFDDRCGPDATPPRILYFDDESEKGWRDLFLSLLYSTADRPADHFRTVSKIPESISENWVAGKVSEASPDLVLLDLRLRGVHDMGIPVAETSGAQVAKHLRSVAPGLPIIMLTASNKAWTFEEMMRLGVDGYWVKEGIGDHVPPGDSVENYRKLLTLVKTALGDEYQFYRRMADAVARLKKLPDPWWLNMDWRQQFHVSVPQTTRAPREQIEQLLADVLAMLRQYLHLFVMNYGYRAGGAQEFWRMALMVQAAKIIELVHGYDRLNAIVRELYRPRILAINRRDWLAAGLYASRGKAAHSGANKPSDSQLQCYLALLLAWLRVKPHLCDSGGRQFVPVTEILVKDNELQLEYNELAGRPDTDML